YFSRQSVGHPRVPSRTPGSPSTPRSPARRPPPPRRPAARAPRARPPRPRRARRPGAPPAPHPPLPPPSPPPPPPAPHQAVDPHLLATVDHGELHPTHLGRQDGMHAERAVTGLDPSEAAQNEVDGAGHRTEMNPLPRRATPRVGQIGPQRLRENAPGTVPVGP